MKQLITLIITLNLVLNQINAKINTLDDIKLKEN